MCDDTMTLSEEEILENLNLLNKSFRSFLELMNLTYRIKLAKND